MYYNFLNVKVNIKFLFLIYNFSDDTIRSIAGVI